MITVPVPLPEHSYAVSIGVIPPAETASLLARSLGRPTGVAVLADEKLVARVPRVAALVSELGARLPGLRVLELPAGESCKSLEAIANTCQWLAANGFDRGAAVIGIGGGAASDHAGFAAAVYLRGVPFALCSTTLLGMVDASVGGKTGVDLPAGKNLVGAFHQPKAVVADLGFLETLPRREMAAGMAEIVKAGFIADAELLAEVEAAAAAGTAYTLPVLERAVAASVRVKVEVVTCDEREAGRRAILNFGHTLGHAIEAESAYDLLHGEAVSLGMMAAFAFGQARGVGDAALARRAAAVLERLGLPVDVASRVTPAVLARVEVDKKRRSDRVGFVFVPRAGEAYVEEVLLEEIRRLVPAALGVSPAGG